MAADYVPTGISDQAIRGIYLLDRLFNIVYFSSELFKVLTQTNTHLDVDRRLH